MNLRHTLLQEQACSNYLVPGTVVSQYMYCSTVRRSSTPQLRNPQHPQIPQLPIHSSCFLTIWVSFVHEGNVEKMSEKATLEATLVAFVLCFLPKNPLFRGSGLRMSYRPAIQRYQENPLRLLFLSYVHVSGFQATLKETVQRQYRLHGYVVVVPAATSSCALSRLPLRWGYAFLLCAVFCAIRRRSVVTGLQQQYMGYGVRRTLIIYFVRNYSKLIVVFNNLNHFQHSRCSDFVCRIDYCCLFVAILHSMFEAWIDYLADQGIIEAPFRIRGSLDQCEELRGMRVWRIPSRDAQQQASLQEHYSEYWLV